MTENKRYFKRMWEEEYYIFDSETISEKEFDEKVEYEDYRAFEDSMQGDEVVNRLNGLDGTIKDLSDDYEQLLKENKELRIQYNHIREQSNEFHRIARENANRVGKLEKENEQLKSQREDFKRALSEKDKEIMKLRRENNQMRRTWNDRE